MNAQENSKKRIWGNVLTVIIILLALTVIAAAVLFGYNRFTLSLIPNGSAELQLGYGETYQEPGAQASFYGSRFWTEGFVPDVTIQTEGSVDTAVLGTYTVTYNADYYLWHAAAQRTVHVVDTIVPEITLLGEREVYVRPGGTYQETGFKAYDAYDGNLTEHVERHEADGIITYSVSDFSGNYTEITRIVHYEDPVPPEITLAGESEVQIYAGTKYEEPGYSAWDNCDGDVSDYVTVDGAVDMYRSGTYTLAYSVTDSYDNTTTVERTVSVVPVPQPEVVSPEGKVIYLTFDDGPCPYTRELLEVLEKYNVKATFFIVCNKYSDIVAEIAEAGHSIGIHSACHDYRTIYASEEAYFADLNQVQAMIYEQTGSTTTLLRFPGGSSNTVSRFNEGIMTRLSQAVQDAGFQYFDWNVDSQDAGGAKTAEEVYENVVAGVSGRRVSIVLQHDIKDYSVAAVEKIIIWGLQNGYVFLPLEQTSPCFHHGINN